MRRFSTPLIAAIFIAASAWWTCAAAQNNTQSEVVRTDQVQAKLLAHAPQGVRPGQPLWLGLQITHQPDWHTYWKNPGDSGLPTDLAWTLPAGLDAGEIASASNALVAEAVKGLEGEALITRHTDLLIDLGTSQGIFLAEGSLHPDTFCAEAAEARADGSYDDHWR